MSIASTDAATGKPTYNDASTTEADIQAAVDYAEKVGNHRRGTSAERNALTTVAEGLMFSETDTKSIWLYAGGAWVLLYAVGHWAQKIRSQNDNYSINTFIDIGLGCSITNALAGIYEFSVDAIISSTAANAGNTRVTLNGNNVLGVDIGFDIPVAGNRTSFSTHGFYQHTGGTLSLVVFDKRTAGTPTIYQGSSTTLKLYASA